MNEHAGNLEGIADIVAPMLPAENVTGSVTLIIATLCAAIAVSLWLAWRRARQPRRRALRMLAKLDTDMSPHHAHETAFRLAAILRYGLGQTRISPATPLPASIAGLQSRWDAFVTSLHRARYAAACPDPDSLRQLLVESGFWLRAWR